MGLKSGSRDADLDDTRNGAEHRDRHEEPMSERRETTTAEPRTAAASTTPVTANDSESESASGRPTIDSIPYILRRDKVNEDREQVPFFLREKVIDSEDELHDSLEALLGEDVFKSDYREAAMIVAQRNPELVAEVLREWGYDLDSAE